MADGSEDKPAPRRWLRLIESDDADPMDVLRTVGTYQRYLAAIQERAVATARGMGRSWEEIGEALGVTRQSAWGKYGQRMLTAELALVHPRFLPITIRLKCPECGTDKVLRVRRRDEEILALDDEASTEFVLPGNVRWTCPGCGHEQDRHVEAPGGLAA